MGSGTSSRPKYFSCQVNVYNLLDERTLGSLLGEISGLRALHTGVEIVPCKKQKDNSYKKCGIGREYAFGSNGVWEQRPKEVPKFENTQTTYRTTVDMGVFTMSSKELKNIINQTKKEFPGETYDILTKNCNHFSDAICLKLVKKNIPKDINRLANTTVGALGILGGMMNAAMNLLDTELQAAQQRTNLNLNRQSMHMPTNNYKNTGPEIVQLN